MADGTQTTTGNLAVITSVVNWDGGAGNDRLDADLGPDTMAGGAGNDRNVVFDPRAVLTELVTDAGNDILLLGPSFVLEEEQSIETIAFIFDAEITRLDLTGNELTRFIRGNSGANILSTGAGPGPILSCSLAIMARPISLGSPIIPASMNRSALTRPTPQSCPPGLWRLRRSSPIPLVWRRMGWTGSSFNPTRASCFSMQRGWVEQRRYFLRN